MDNPSKTIWLVSSNRWYSAVTAYAIQTALALEAQGCSCVFTPIEDSPGFYKAKQEGLDVRPLRGFGMTHYFAFRRVFTKVQPAIIIVFGGPETFLLHCLSASGPIIRFRGQDNELLQGGRLTSLWQRRIALLITPSEAYRKAFLIRYRQPVYAVHYGLREETFYFQGTARSKRPTVLLVGRLDPIKGHGAFFQLFSKILECYPRTQELPYLKIIGEEANLSAADLHAQAREARLVQGKDYDINTERIANIQNEMNQASVGLISSLGSEIICRVGAEFLMCGTPIMVTAVGSLGELLFPNAGMSYPEQRVEDISLFILRSFEEDPSVRLARQDQARRRFSLKVMGAQMVAILNSLSGT